MAKESTSVEMPTGGVSDLIACLDSLPTEALKDLTSLGNLAECNICLDKFEVEDVVKKLPCGDIFHSGCMEQWGQENDNCQCGKPWRPQ
mmetsp:Transcript_5676/g.7792  ORF Transcript_5676/g.7792 Transcript_5676/m.7792 type:complete len:89 (+) Transcript_5676:94-360(+)